MPLHGIREDPGRCASRGGPPVEHGNGVAMATTSPASPAPTSPSTAMTVIQGCAIATMDPARTELSDGHVVVSGNRIQAIGEGPAPRIAGSRVVAGSGCLLTPGLVNTHHHLYQWVTRGLAADATLFEWLTKLYPVWAGIDEYAVNVAARGGLSWLARTGCTLTSDHHYVFPRDGGDVLAAEIEAARCVGLRFHPARGSMDLGRSQGGLPPDSVVEDRDAALAATEAAVARLDAADRRGAVLPVLGLRRADERGRHPGPPARGAPAHPPRGDPRRGGL